MERPLGLCRTRHQIALLTLIYHRQRIPISANDIHSNPRQGHGPIFGTYEGAERTPTEN